MINIIIADDHPVMINGVISILSQEPNLKIIATVNSSKQLMEKLKSLSPDIILMDAAMHELDGIEAARLIHDKYSDVKILFYSQFDSKWLIKKCLQVGAKGYLVKNVSKKDLVEAINLVDKGGLNFFYKDGIQ